jgi:integrase/recombinase XerD
VRGPKHVVKRGKTPVLSEEQARQLLASIKVRKMIASEDEVPVLVGLRDRALIGVMVYSFARINAVVAMEVEDYFSNGKPWWLRLHEKGGKRHEMPAHHKLESGRAVLSFTEFGEILTDMGGIADKLSRLEVEGPNS